MPLVSLNALIKGLNWYFSMATIFELYTPSSRGRLMTDVSLNPSAYIFMLFL